MLSFGITGWWIKPAQLDPQSKSGHSFYARSVKRSDQGSLRRALFDSGVVVLVARRSLEPARCRPHRFHSLPISLALDTVILHKEGHTFSAFLRLPNSGLFGPVAH